MMDYGLESTEYRHEKISSLRRGKDLILNYSKEELIVDFN